MEEPTTVKEVWKMACPNCGKDGHLGISALVSVKLTADGTDADALLGGHEWDSASACWCDSCGYRGTVADFEVKDTQTCPL